MADSFAAKRKQGLVQGHGSGYGGTGFKFDKHEESQVKAARKAKAKVRGVGGLGGCGGGGVLRQGMGCCCGGGFFGLGVGSESVECWTSSNG